MMTSSTAHDATVLRSSARAANMQSMVLQRKCACGSGKSSGNCTECDEKEQRLKLQRKANSDRDVGEVPPIVYDVLRSTGQPLETETRAFFEPRFRHDFSQVRVHTDQQAAESAKSVNARAYTVGRDIAFGTGEYAPNSNEGRRLLAHELTHVLQHGYRANNSSLTIGPVGSACENEADRVTEGVMGNSMARIGQIRHVAEQEIHRVCYEKPTGPFPGDVFPEGSSGTCSTGKKTALEAAARIACLDKSECDFPELATEQGAWAALPRIAIRMTGFAACYVAKWLVMVTCFKGGDTGHNEALWGYCNGMKKCYEQQQKALRTLAKFDVPLSEIVAWLAVAGVASAIAFLIAGSLAVPIATFAVVLLSLFGLQSSFTATNDDNPGEASEVHGSGIDEKRVGGIQRT